jgi:hypothetical protein
MVASSLMNVEKKAYEAVIDARFPHNVEVALATSKGRGDRSDLLKIFPYESGSVRSSWRGRQTFIP